MTTGHDLEQVLDISEVPFDPSPEPDQEGDDSFHAEPHGLLSAMKAIDRHVPDGRPKKRPVKVKYPYVWIPFQRKLSVGEQGPDAKALYRALSHMGYGKLPWEDDPSSRYTRKLAHAVQVAHQHFHQGKSEVYDKRLHTKLLEHRAFDRYGAHLMRSWHPPRVTKEQKQRQAVVNMLWFGYSKRDIMDYEAVRPMLDMSCPPNVNTVLDCSEFYTWCCQCSGVQNPNGHDYNGWGFTGEIAQHCKHVPGFGKPGDSEIYGAPFPYHHVSGAVGNVKKMEVSGCVSMGSDPGPLYLPVRYRGDWVGAWSPWT